MDEEDNTTVADLQFLEEIIKMNEELIKLQERSDLLVIKKKAEGN